MLGCLRLWADPHLQHATIFWELGGVLALPVSLYASFPSLCARLILAACPSLGVGGSPFSSLSLTHFVPSFLLSRMYHTRFRCPRASQWAK